MEYVIHILVVAPQEYVNISLTRRIAHTSEFRIRTPSKAVALTLHRALTWYCSPARPFAALDVPLFVTVQQGSTSPACQQLSRARNPCAGSPSEDSTKLQHGINLERTICYSPK